MPTCLCCEKDYNIEDSTAFAHLIIDDKETTQMLYDNRQMFCSKECEAIDQEWLTNGNKIMDSAKAENPQLFLRTSMTKEQNEALSSIKKMGLNFRNEDIANMVPGDENA